MIVTILVGLAAGVGALARYVIDRVVQHWYDSEFPYGTFTINTIGSLLLGLISGLAAHHGLPSGPAVVLSAGFCGGFTTWSTFAYESVALAETGAVWEAAANIAGSVTVGLLAAAAGFALALL
jgi:fluoride exporter